MTLGQETVVFTGRLGMTRAYAAQLAENAGATVKNSITSKTTLVVAGEQAGAKLDKATELGIRIISEKQFLDEVEEKKKTKKTNKKTKKSNKKTQTTNKKTQTKKTKKTNKTRIPSKSSGPRKVTLQYVDESQNHDKFYNLNLNGTTVKRHWGRNGAKGQTKSEKFPTKQEAILNFDGLFFAKTGNEYSNLDDFHRVKGKYELK